MNITRRSLLAGASAAAVAPALPALASEEKLGVIHLARQWQETEGTTVYFNFQKAPVYVGNRAAARMAFLKQTEIWDMLEAVYDFNQPNETARLSNLKHLTLSEDAA